MQQVLKHDSQAKVDIQRVEALMQEIGLTISGQLEFTLKDRALKIVYPDGRPVYDFPRQFGEERFEVLG